MDNTREKWLHRALPVMMAWLKDAGCKDFPVPHLSFGVPKKGWGNGKKMSIAECWPRAVTQKQDRNVIHISPRTGEPVAVLGSLLHELVHASDDCESKHRGHFKHVALALGFTPPMTCTPLGPQLKIALEKLASDLGPLDHDPMVNFRSLKRKRSRVKYTCATCGDSVNGKKVWHAMHMTEDGDECGEYEPEEE